jgi:hypothetical protein
MRVQAAPTEIFVSVDGSRCRVWNATTEQGEQVFLFVKAVASRAELAELMATATPEVKREWPN